MHIEIDLELQKLNSQSTKNILPQEKDWFLNKEVIKYLQSKTNPTSNVKQLGFEDTAKRIEDIKDLIRIANRPVQVNSQGKSFITFPYDYFGYIRFDTYMIKNCPPISVVPTTVPSYKTTFKIEMPLTALNTYTISIVTTGGTTIVFDITDINDLPSGYLSTTEFKKQEFLLIKALKIKLLNKIKSVLSPNAVLYWEKEGYIYNSSSFTLVSDITFLSVNVITNGTTIVNTMTTVNQSIYVINDTPLKAKTRVVDDEYLTDIENSHLSKSRSYSPVSVIRENVLELSNISSAIYGSVDIIYICTPSLIDLFLSSNLNVSEKVAKEIVSNTVRTLKGIIESKDYQTYAQETILTE